MFCAEYYVFFFFFKQKTAYELRISDWSSDVCSSDLKSIKRLLAYSSINNIGFALVGLAAGTPEGVSSVLVYMTVYIVMTLGSFMVVIRMRDEEGRQIETLASLSGMSKTRPGLALAFMAVMFSLAGIPPLFGFFPKLAVRSEEHT